MRRSFRSALLAVVLLTAAAACGDATAPDTSYVGTYTLRSIDGEAVPITLYDDGTDVATLTSGTLILNADETFTTSVDITYTVGGSVQHESEWLGGSFRRSGRTFTLTDALGDSYVATWNGTDTMTIDDGESIVVFRR